MNRQFNKTFQVEKNSKERFAFDNATEFIRFFFIKTKTKTKTKTINQKPKSKHTFFIVHLKEVIKRMKTLNLY